MKATLLGSLLFASSLLPTVAGARFPNDFDGYPVEVRACLVEADEKSQCPGETVKEMNACLCSDGSNFITMGAKCMGGSLDEDKRTTISKTTYDIFEQHCGDSGTPFKYEWPAFLGLVNEGVDLETGSDTSAAPTPTTTDGEQKDGEEDKDEGGLAMGAIIGIAVGAGVIIIGAIIAAVMLLRRRKKRHLEESHPMLINQAYSGSGGGGSGIGFPAGAGSHQSHHGSMYHSPNDVKAELSNPSSPSTWRPASHSPGLPVAAAANLAPGQQGAWGGGDPRHQSWNSQQQPGGWSGHQSWSSATQPYHSLGTQQQEQQHQQQPALFELPNNPAAQVPHQPPPVEMPATPMDRR